MSDYPKLQPLPLRDEALPGYDPVAWKPNWNCFCCHDTGIIPELSVKKIIANYVSGRHKPVECNATKCNIQLGRDLYSTNTLDRRFTFDLCDRLDREDREMWLQWSQKRHEKRREKLKLLNLDLTKNLRVRDRTNYEQLEAEQKHQQTIDRSNRC